MKSPKDRFLARARRAKPDRRGLHAFTKPRAARLKPIRAARRKAEDVLRWQKAESDAEAIRSRLGL